MRIACNKSSSVFLFGMPRYETNGTLHRCISFKDSACRCFGYAVSKKRYIYTIDDDCFVAKDPSGEQINSLKQHIKNLLSPSTPFFFNTLYDPYAQGTDFVRGYPFSLREGAPTAVSHGVHLFPGPPFSNPRSHACVYFHECRIP